MAVTRGRAAPASAAPEAPPRASVLLAGAAEMRELARRPLAHAADRERRDAMRSERARTRFTASRALAAELLERHGFPGPPRITADRLGRPLLPERCGLSVSISHTETWIAVAVSSSPSCGVDVQSPVDPARFPPVILESFLPPGWVGHLDRDLDPTRRFTRMWASVEAGLKWHGTGFATGLDALAWRTDGRGSSVTDPATGRSARIHVHDLDDGSALAFATAPCAPHEVEVGTLRDRLRLPDETPRSPASPNLTGRGTP
ncbi:4'-phosphopantetheinyl transferase superfamily protein [Clavibacter sp. VKM Ac-2542]|uniref:4'-phosphopantetheinyl transferase family protein n=1 Tax=Clavibacter sp. VKM Ac-2542 TaxID=2783811 RepID=UPI00188A6C3C|nr:4'-phosphopantetheinyl transferase superfamily protein [Clavibacter sp. VKM Ac-2542]MBF4621309.1 hypothetical protein [Clavibacter sp. VKM Ac-2542]